MGGYHVGRLLTYVILGAIAGVAGKAIGLIGDGAGIQSASARLAGGLMILIGVWRLSSLWKKKATSSFGLLNQISSHIAKTVAGLRPHLAKLPITARSIGIGAVTVLLPCGWLYLFVLFAAGSGSVSSAIGVMAAFWLGTIPSLVAMVSGSLQLNHASRQALPRFMPAIGAMVLILFGAHTATGRASADLRQLESRIGSVIADQNQSRIDVIQAIQSQPLPCCQNAK
jgi:sulfite exporter TauE/SafE